MIDLNYIKSFYPAQLSSNPAFERHMLKEYIELLALDHLSTTEYIDKLSFIGGTNLRIIKGLDRWSEDIDFDFKGLTKAEFISMTDAVAGKLTQNGLRVEIRDRENPRLTAYRRSIYFPQLLFDLDLTGHREERFLLKVEAQDQGVGYERRQAVVERCGFFFKIPVPTDSVLLSMKLAAVLSRSKGRDFYDSMFLWQQTQPDYAFLTERVGIPDLQTLKQRLAERLESVSLEEKMRDFQHLLFDSSRASRILSFGEYVAGK